MLNFWILSRGLHLGQEGFAGQFSWSGPTVTGGCKPVSCDGKRLNDKPGPECQCAKRLCRWAFIRVSFLNVEFPQLGPPPSVYSDEGNFSGEPCMPAECPIPNSIGKGPDCRCVDKFVGEIRWQGIVSLWRMSFQPRAMSQHSNNKPGPECACAFGYEEVVPIYQSMVGGELSGTCDPIPCEGEKSNHQDGPGCGCADGLQWKPFKIGTVVKNDVTKLFSESGSGPALSNFTVFKADSCTPAKCAVEKRHRRWPGVPLRRWLSGQCRMDWAQCDWKLANQHTVSIKNSNRKTWFGLQMLRWIYWQYLGRCFWAIILQFACM